LSHNPYLRGFGETMSMLARSGLAVLALLSMVLAGCSGGGGADPTDDVPTLEVTSTTGGIRGVVVDSSIRPIKEATVEVEGVGKSVTTDETGLFAFSGLDAGNYFVKASHPLYDLQQQNVEVQAGVADPKPVKFLLNRVVLETPYLNTIKFDGFIVCSINVDQVGYSEECGEGVGVPCAPDPVPPNVTPCGRVGGQGNNAVQMDFTVGAGAKSIVLEQVWQPTSEAGRAFFTLVSTEWLCDPFCGGNSLFTMDGESPLLGRADEEEMADNEIQPDSTIITSFTYASLSSNPAGAVLNQPFQNFVTIAYYLPLPEGWSFVNGDPDPFA
jgi:hypothetical protein